MNTCVDHYKNKQWAYFSIDRILLVLTKKRNRSGTRPKSACSKSSSYRFSLSAARNAITKATEYVISGFSFFIPF